jgi:tRNA dimethylallyltransferase
VNLEIDSELSRTIDNPEPLPAKQNQLVVILGPTAVGKTEIAIELAERLDGEIVSADSRLLYRGMDIGTAKPTYEQRKRIPHYLIDVADPDQVWSLTLYQEAANKAISDIQVRNKIPFLVGGTGQYIRAVIEAWRVPSTQPDPRLRKSLENWVDSIGPKGLHQRLSALDPQAAGKIDYRNVRRTIRALEVILHSGRRFSDQRGSAQPPYQILQIGLTLPRPDLYKRIDARIEAMLDGGFIEEVQSLLEKRYMPDLPSFSAIGYQEIINYLAGKTTLEEAVMLMKRRSRQYVRRQANWFKVDDPSIHWFQVGAVSIDVIEHEIQNFLTS